LSETISKNDIKSWVEDAVKDTSFECPDCHASFAKPTQYMDHRIGEFMNQKIAEVKAPDPEKLVLDCKDGICKMIEEHVEATYDIHKKGKTPVVEEEEEPGLFSVEDDPEDE